MMFLAIGRPSPVPVRRVVKYGSKMCAMSSALMPVPWSCTVIAHASGRVPSPDDNTGLAGHGDAAVAGRRAPPARVAARGRRAPRDGRW